MTDIVERLRWLYTQNGMNHVQEAADEIERLRAERDALKAALEQYGQHTDGCRRELASRGCHCGLFDALRGEEVKP